jgi:hypothetical protein
LAIGRCAYENEYAYSQKFSQRSTDHFSIKRRFNPTIPREIELQTGFSVNFVFGWIVEKRLMIHGRLDSQQGLESLDMEHMG